jgi:hypothetical protein
MLSERDTVLRVIYLITQNKEIEAWTLFVPLLTKLKIFCISSGNNV